MWKTRSSSAQRLATAQRVEQLAALLAAGTPLPAAAAALARTESDPRLARQLGQTAARLEQGAPLGEALEPLGLGELATDRDPAGRTALRSDPTRALQTLARHLRRRAELRITWRRALAYPTLLASLLVVGWFALPGAMAPLQRLLREMGAGSLSPISEALFSWARGSRLSENLLLILGAAVAALWLLRGLTLRLLYAVQRRSGILRRLTAAELLEGTALHLRLDASPSEAAGRALTETLRRYAPSTPDDASASAEKGPLERHAPSLAALARAIGALRAKFAPHWPTPINLEAGLSAWLRPLELLPLIAAQQRAADSAELAAVAEGLAADLHDEAQRRITLLGPISVGVMGLVVLLVAWGFAGPLFQVGSRLGGPF